MFKRIFLSSQVQKLLDSVRVTKSHESLHLSLLDPFFQQMVSSSAKRGVFLSELSRRIRSHNTTRSIKALIVVHYLINHCSGRFQCIMEQLLIILQDTPVQAETTLPTQPMESSFQNKTLPLTYTENKSIIYDKSTITHTTQPNSSFRGRSMSSKKNNPKQNERCASLSKSPKLQKQDFVHTTITTFYLKYLISRVSKRELYAFAQQPLTTTPVGQVCNMGFSILNLTNFILTSQMAFCKMGRYYPTQHEMFNLFVMLLRDLAVFNAFVKNAAHKCIEDAHLGTDLNHVYLFISEAQKTSDRLYEYFHNRYYYDRTVCTLGKLPTFLTIAQPQYQQFLHKVKQTEAILVKIVRKSRFTKKNQRETEDACQMEYFKTENQK